MFFLKFAAQLRFGKIGMDGLSIITFHHHMVPGRGAKLCVNRQLVC
jgi:hypothetical protein